MMPDTTPTALKFRPHRCRYRPLQLSTDHYAVVERSTNAIIVGGFDSETQAWEFIANRLLLGANE
jgi:hypothetical protein